MPEFPNKIQQYKPVWSKQIIETGEREWSGPAWLGDLLFRFGWLREQCLSSKVLIYTKLQSEPIHLAILEAIEDAHRVLYHDKVTVIMGSEDFSRLTQQAQPDWFDYTAGPFMDGRTGSTVYGVPVRVMPWIKGWAVI